MPLTAEVESPKQIEPTHPTNAQHNESREDVGLAQILQHEKQGADIFYRAMQIRVLASQNTNMPSRLDALSNPQLLR